MFVLLSSNNGEIVIPIRKLDINDGYFLVYKYDRKLILKKIGDLSDNIAYVKVQIDNVPGIKAKIMLKLAEYGKLRVARFEERKGETIIHLIIKVVDDDSLKKLSEDLRKISNVKKYDISILNHSLN